MYTAGGRSSSLLWNYVLTRHNFVLVCFFGMCEVFTGLLCELGALIWTALFKMTSAVQRTLWHSDFSVQNATQINQLWYPDLLHLCDIVHGQSCKCEHLQMLILWILMPVSVTWQVVGGVVVRSVVLDEWGDRGDVAGVHGWHAGGVAHRRGLVVQVQHPAERVKHREVRALAALMSKL